MSDNLPLSQLPKLPWWLALPAFGLGSGYSPKAPGTMGSLVALLLVQLMLHKMSSPSSLRMLVLRRLQLSKRFAHLTPAWV